MRYPDNYALLPQEACGYEDSPTVVLPVPFERTVSYGKGTAGGPEAIILASQYMELWDEELGNEPFRPGIATLPSFEPKSSEIAAALDEIEAEARRHLEAGKFLITLGGEHSLTLAPVRASRAVFGEIGVVQFDAHADLRADYQGTPFSHACVMRRIVEEGIPTAAVGLRSLSTPEAQFAAERRLPVLWAYQMEREPGRFAGLLEELPEKVYLTFDIDYFDPSLVPATGTPEPGGGFWYPTLELLKVLFARKQVVAMDVVELAPQEGSPASDFVAAKLIYKCLGYRREYQR
ncbi:MAG: agmatinase [Thermoanaerobaculia bacterium]